MIVYKVVRKVREPGAKRTSFKSAAAINGGKYNLDYRIGRKRYAPKKSLMFVFKSLGFAQDFVSWYHSVKIAGYRILECETDAVEPIRALTGNTVTEALFKAFWERIDLGEYVYRNEPPKGTIGCKSLTPLRIVKRG